MGKSNPVWLGAAVFLICLAGAWLSLRGVRPYPLTDFDQIFYISIAWQWLEFGVFGNGIFGGDPGSLLPPPPGMFLGPLYPAIVAAGMWLDAPFREAAACVVAGLGSAEPANCARISGPMRLFHAAFLAAGLSFLFLASQRLTGRLWAALLSVLMAVPALLVYRRLFGYVMTESLGFMLFGGVAWGVVMVMQRGRVGMALGCGLLLGLLVLVRPSHIILVPCLMVLFAATGLRAGVRRAILPACLLLGYLAVTLPWAARNAVQVGHFGLSQGYGAAVLMERVTYNRMTGREWALGWIYDLPDFGDALARRLAGDAAIARLDWARAGSLYDQGTQRRAEAFGDYRGMLPSTGEMLREMAADPLWHGMVTLSFIWRGFWVGQYWMFGVLLALPLAMGAMRRSISPGAVLAYAALPILMLVAHAGASINQVRYNLALIYPGGLVLAFAAMGLAQGLDRFRSRQRAGRS